MLEIKNLTKIYKSKGGVEVKALDDISLKFPENGMIFLLGKSGSGKSTLLNVCGGLDNPTTGEIIVKDRSSIDFKQKDFDSYRNTFVGFIFQEYNILEEFTVEENIALALELQGKERNKESINAILEKVDLKGYNDRKPNTLSGGQKQRLAIARALVKSPEIIMADEPTGALDSKTGEQVFDTLKELSKDTLIMVVSHDRDFAERYADRIIELKDGKVISDLTKEKDSFKETSINDIEIKKYTKKDSEFISSKFPLRHAVRMGLSSLKLKKFRLFMTTCLCTVAFIMFGLLSTLIFYDKEANFKDTIKNSNLSYMQLIKEYEVKNINYTNGEESYNNTFFEKGNFTDKEVTEYINKYGESTFRAVLSYDSYNVHNNSHPYYVSTIYAYGYLEENNSYRENMIGDYPKKTDEIAITTYIADVIINCKIDDLETGKTMVLNERKDLIGKKIRLKENVYTITGIIDSGKIDKKYDSIKISSKVDKNIREEYTYYLTDGIHLVTFVSKEFLSIASLEKAYQPDNFSDRTISIAPLIDGKYDFDKYQMGYYSSYEFYNDDYEIYKLKDFDTLKDNEIIVSYNFLAELIINSTNYENKLHKIAQPIYYNGEEYYIGDKWNIRRYSFDELSKQINILYETIKNGKKTYNVGIKLFNPYQGTAVGSTYEFEIVGLIIPKSHMDNRMLVNNKTYDELLNYEKTNYENTTIIETKYVNEGFANVIYVPYDKKDDSINEFWSIRSNEKLDKNGTKLGLTGSTINVLDSVDDIVESFSQLFLWGGIVLAVFAALLFSNFISVSIANKKKEIGILRAIGAKGSDVFKIFFSESVILSIVCVITSSIGTIFIGMLLNKLIDLGVSIFVFGITSLLVIILIATLTALLATFLPVFKIARKKPIESIRNA